MDWITPVTDRTLSDVNRLKALRNKIALNSYDSLTQEEKIYWMFGNSNYIPFILSNGDILTTSENEAIEVLDSKPGVKGAFNYADLNRVENNIQYVSDLLKGSGYYNNVEVKTNWTMNDLPYLDDFNRIRNNINSLLDAFTKYSDAPVIRYGDRFDYNDANTFEKLIDQTLILLNFMIEQLRPASTFYAGEV